VRGKVFCRLNRDRKRIALKDGGWLLANALGIAIYLSLESWVLAPRSEAEALNGIDQIYFWLTRNLPLLVVYLVLNVIWLIRIRSRSDPSNKWPFRNWLLVCLAWAIALIYHGLTVKILKILIAMIDGKAWK
jgi:uncharacterized membrane protein SirB2